MICYILFLGLSTKWVTGQRLVSLKDLSDNEREHTGLGDKSVLIEFPLLEIDGKTVSLATLTCLGHTFPLMEH